MKRICIITRGLMSYDEKTETRTLEEQNPVNGEWEVSKIKFKDVLFNRCYKETQYLKRTY
jgi:hypothetical protein